MAFKKYEKAVMKTANEMKAGDVFRCEYGDYDNWCNFVFESCKTHDKRTTEITFHWIGRTESEKCYEFTPIERMKFEVVGEETTEVQEAA